MKQIVLRVEDSAYEILRNTFTLMNGVEVEEVFDAIEITGSRDECVKEAITTLLNDHVIRRPRDYAWLMIAFGQGAVGSDLNSITSPQAFINYLEFIGIKDVPCRTTLFNVQNITFGTFPNWTFSDTKKPNEIIRRKNIVTRFLSAYVSAKRRILNSNLNKSF